MGRPHPWSWNIKLRTFYLRDYLAPGGNHPYSQLATDLEECRKAGYEVCLKSVPGFIIAFGTPDNKYRGIFAKYPWTDTDGRFYRTAEECIARKNHKLQED